VSRYEAGSSAIYASLFSTAMGSRLRVFDGGAWYERSAGLPSGILVRGGFPHPTDTQKAYALMDGMEFPGKVFKTTNRGVTWTNITAGAG
jgi:hypothetical protein